MQNHNRLPDTWTPGNLASVISIGAVAALCACFFVICLLRHLGVQALTYTGLGTLLMIGLAMGQWLGMKRSAGGPPR